MAPRADSACVVVGGCGGIGLAYVTALASIGVRVAVVDLPTSLASTILPTPVLAIEGDASNPAGLTHAVNDAVRQLGGIDSLAYVSGINIALTPAESLELRSWQRVLDVNVTGAFVAAKAAMPWLRQSGAGSILFVASGLFARPDPGFAAYAASKGALVSLMKALAAEGAPSVRANAVAPGLVATAFLHGGTGGGASREGDSPFVFGAPPNAERVLQNIPMRRLGTPEDIAGAMLFLSSANAAYITGQVLFINGGRYAQ